MSPKNKGKFGKGTSEVEETDEFVSGVNKVFAKLTPHAKRIGVTVAVVVVGFLGYVIYDYYQDRSERLGTDLYVAAADIQRHQVLVGDGLSPDQPMPDPDEITPVDRKAPTYKTTREHAEKSLAALKKLSSEAGDSAAGAHGKLLEARALLDLGKHDEAMEIYKSYASSAPSELVRTVAREGIGYALEAKAMANTDASARAAGLKQAIEAFRKVQPKDKGPRWHYALYHEARLLGAIDDKASKAKAAEIYQKVLDAEPPAALSYSINGRLAMLDVVSTMPSAVPAAPSVPSTPAAPEAPETPETPEDDANDADGDKTGETPATGQ